MLFLKWCYIVEKQYIFCILFYKMIKNVHKTIVSNDFLKKKLLLYFKHELAKHRIVFAFVIKPV